MEPRKQRTGPLRRLTAAVTALMFLAACGTWKKPAGTPAATVAASNPDRVRLHLVTGKRADVYGAAIVDDRIVGWTAPGQHGLKDASYPLADIQSMDVRVTSPGKTVAIVLAAGVTAGVTLFLVALSSSNLLGNSGRAPRDHE